MAIGANISHDNSLRFRRLRLVVLVIFLGGLATAGLIAVELGGKIRELRQVPRDNIQWNTAQLEVDFLKLRTALDAAIEDPATLDELRKQFDIFYSRVKTLEGSTQTLNLADNPELRTHRHDLEHFLMMTVPLIDSSDAVLIDALPQIDSWIEELVATPRLFALGAVQVMASLSDQQRTEIVELLRRLALVALGVFGALILTLATMTWQRLELSRRAAAISRAGRMRESTLRASLDAIVVIDDQGLITDFNGSAEKIFGFRKDEIIGRKLSETIVPPAFREAHAEGFVRYTSSDTSNIVDQGRLELIAMHRDGHEFPIEVSISETAGETGPAFVSYIRDITEEKRAKAELQQARDDALTAFREKSHFFAVMSHEMRTPLNGIMSALDLMTDDPLTDKQKRYVTIAESSSQVLLGHINDVLLIERLDSGERTAPLAPFRPVALVDAVADSMRPVAGQQNTTVVTEHSGPDACVLGQSRALQQVVMNLLSNAVKFTPSGKVTIRTATRAAGNDEVELAIAVADTGIGISEEDQARIFEDFVTIDSPYERTATGTGLGLGIVRRLVQQMQGEVTCESVPDEGTTFHVTLTLPRAEDEDRPAAASGPARDTAEIAPLDVLVVEDNPINAEVLEAMLLREGHKVSHASDGFEGVHVASRTHFDLILMDVSMPNMNGIKATQEIRASRGLSKNSPIYAVTAHAMPNEVKEFLAAGMAGCVLKPIRPDALRKVLHEVARDQEHGQVTAQPHAPEETDMTNAMLIDLDSLEDIAALLGQERFDAKLDSFATEAEDVLRQIDAAAAAGDLPALQSDAHRLAGSCGVFGAVALHRELQAIEARCKADDKTAALDMAAGLPQTWEATRRALNTARV
ncbi:hybrid sensor histidine kinase/response regulator [Marinovum algicola]|jgi:PAS domain S-box-containing protein|uniref:hybrid sensor histidine kinase/response regulator n=1 Tax=Marinovum algicola TaxID=42444 RepID=UPI0024BB6360|nr:PAS domain-containing hybrid sensor histidine kinase/response regulator [Marinovum algicola]